MPAPLPPPPLSAAAWRSLLALGEPPVPEGSAPLVVVDLDDGTATAATEPVAWPFVPVVAVGVTRRPFGHPAEVPGAATCDVVLGPGDAHDNPDADSVANADGTAGANDTHDAADAPNAAGTGDDLAAITATVAANPVAATALAVLLRTGEGVDPLAGLVAESATYSSLQAGAEFARWRASRPVRRRPRSVEPVRLDRRGDVLEVVLHRPEVRNALDAAVRDGLVDALRLAAADPSIARVVLRGAGPSFCSGGDLDEFGTAPEPPDAHLLRLDRSAGRAALAVADRLVAHLHGDCIGSGIELPAFAGRVVADPGARIGLPEVSLGLVPGAGGTVSLPRRIGRHRTARLALTGRTVDAATAHRWGLVDEIARVPPAPGS
mgnify:CR=1 FL=1